jgi:hypothetical protein
MVRHYLNATETRKRGTAGDVLATYKLYECLKTVLDATGVENNLGAFLAKVVQAVAGLSWMSDANLVMESGSVPLCNEDMQGRAYVTEYSVGTTTILAERNDGKLLRIHRRRGVYKVTIVSPDTGRQYLANLQGKLDLDESILSAERLLNWFVFGRSLLGKLGDFFEDVFFVLECDFDHSQWSPYTPGKDFLSNTFVQGVQYLGGAISGWENAPMVPPGSEMTFCQHGKAVLKSSLESSPRSGTVAESPCPVCKVTPNVDVMILARDMGVQTGAKSCCGIPKDFESGALVKLEAYDGGLSGQYLLTNSVVLYRSGECGEWSRSVGESIEHIKVTGSLIEVVQEPAEGESLMPTCIYG